MRPSRSSNRRDRTSKPVPHEDEHSDHGPHGVTAQLGESICTAPASGTVPISLGSSSMGSPLRGDTKQASAPTLISRKTRGLLPHGVGGALLTGRRARARRTSPSARAGGRSPACRPWRPSGSCAGACGAPCRTRRSRATRASSRRRGTRLRTGEERVRPSAEGHADQTRPSTLTPLAVVRRLGVLELGLDVLVGRVVVVVLAGLGRHRLARDVQPGQRLHGGARGVVEGRARVLRVHGGDAVHLLARRRRRVGGLQAYGASSESGSSGAGSLRAPLAHNRTM